MIDRLSLALGIGLGLCVAPALAQDSTSSVGAKTDWTIYVEDSPKQCWVVSPPMPGKSTATRDGRPVAVRRGDIFLFVSFWPGGSAGGGGMGEVSFMGGYEFANGEPVKLEIGETSFELFAEGEIAWATTPEEDRKIASAMKAGAQATVTALSERSGTTTKDTFSLMGFTAAFDDAERRCGS